MKASSGGKRNTGQKYLPPPESLASNPDPRFHVNAELQALRFSTVRV